MKYLADAPRPDGLVFLATPYSHAQTVQMFARFNQAYYALFRLTEAGIPAYCPIATCHPMAVNFDLPKDWNFWWSHNKPFLDACAELWVVMMDGWDESRGVREEVEYITAQGKPVRYLYFSMTGLMVMEDD